MPSPFPGMDPYLENPVLWSDVHHSLISIYRETLAAQLRPKYVVKIEERVYISDESDEEFDIQVRVPDVEVAIRAGGESAQFSLGDEAAQLEIAEPVVATTWFEKVVHEAYLTIVDRTSGKAITVIEILSPANKVPNSPGRQSFEEKRREVMNSPTHWVEIDLLRGKRMMRIPKKVGPHEYLIHVSRRTQRPRGQLWGIRLPQRLPVIPIPLKTGDPDGRLDLQAALDTAYDRASYDLRIDYGKEPHPALDENLTAWADQLLRSKRLR
ncbi:MAG: DUF4058 family protein [Isosphaeraceae bacterium]